jgi:hypothetical protein
MTALSGLRVRYDRRVMAGVLARMSRGEEGVSRHRQSFRMTVGAVELRRGGGFAKGAGPAETTCADALERGGRDRPRKKSRDKRFALGYVASHNAVGVPTATELAGL